MRVGRVCEGASTQQMPAAELDIEVLDTPQIYSIRSVCTGLAVAARVYK